MGFVQAIQCLLGSFGNHWVYLWHVSNSKPSPQVKRGEFDSTCGKRSWGSKHLATHRLVRSGCFLLVVVVLLLFFWLVAGLK